MRKCFVLKLEEYSEMTMAYEYYYFQRAKYNHDKLALVPPIEEWDKFCLCRKPYNPDLVTVCCDECN